MPITLNESKFLLWCVTKWRDAEEILTALSLVMSEKCLRILDFKVWEAHPIYCFSHCWQLIMYIIFFELQLMQLFYTVSVSVD